VNRPTETLTAAVSSIVAAVISILVAFYPEVAAKITAEVAAAIVLVLAWVATVVTYFVSRRQTDPTSSLAAAPDGSVVKAEPEEVEVLFHGDADDPGPIRVRP
jgi:hypothetical protein